MGGNYKVGGNERRKEARLKIERTKIRNGKRKVCNASEAKEIEKRMEGTKKGRKRSEANWEEKKQLNSN